MDEAQDKQQWSKEYRNKHPSVSSTNDDTTEGQIEQSNNLIKTLKSLTNLEDDRNKCHSTADSVTLVNVSSENLDNSPTNIHQCDCQKFDDNSSNFFPLDDVPEDDADDAICFEVSASEDDEIDDVLTYNQEEVQNNCEDIEDTLMDENQIIYNNVNINEDNQIKDLHESNDNIKEQESFNLIYDALDLNDSQLIVDEINDYHDESHFGQSENVDLDNVDIRYLHHQAIDTHAGTLSCDVLNETTDNISPSIDVVDDNDLNITNNSIVMDDLEDVSGELLAQIGEQIVIDNGDEDTSLQVFRSDLEFEFFDILNDVTRLEYTNQSLSEAQNEIISLLDEIKGDINKADEPEFDYSNKSNSNVDEQSCKKFKAIEQKMDEQMYNSIVLLEKTEDNYYQQSICQNPLQFYKIKCLGMSLLNIFVDKFVGNCVIFKDKLEMSTYKLEFLQIEDFRISAKDFLHHVFVERLIVVSEIEFGYLVLREFSIVSIKDYLNILFDEESIALIKKRFYEEENVLTFIEDMFARKHENVAYFEISRRLCFDALSAVEYLHRKNIIHRNLSTLNTGITVDGFLKLGGFNYMKKEKLYFQSGAINYGKENVNYFSFDYLFLGQMLIEIIIPAVEWLEQSQLSLNSFILSRDLSEKNDFNDVFRRIGNEDLGRFLQSFFRPSKDRCHEYLTKIIIRKYKWQRSDFIICLEKIRKLSFFSNLDFNLNCRNSSVFLSKEFLEIIHKRLALIRHLQ